MPNPIPFGQETHEALRLQYEAAPPAYRRGMARVWTGTDEATTAELIAGVNRHATVRCPDCGVRRGEVHRPRCDVEECPVCHLQRIGCEHP